MCFSEGELEENSVVRKFRTTAADSKETSHEITDELFIGKSTVDTHRKNMIRKLDLSGSGELLRYAVAKKYEF